ncbi:MAG: HD domain-containing protein [Microgenomates group bacterium]
MNDLDGKIERAVKYLASRMPDASKLVKPTLLHSLRVGLVLHSYGYSGNVVVAGLLHDLVEDANVTIKEIETEFGIEVAKLVEVETKDPDIQDEIEKADHLIDKLLKFGEDALVIKASDLLDNLVLYKKRDDSKAIYKLTRMSINLLKNKPQSLKGDLFDTLANEINFVG